MFIQTEKYLYMSYTKIRCKFSLIEIDLLISNLLSVSNTSIFIVIATMWIVIIYIASAVKGTLWVHRINYRLSCTFTLLNREKINKLIAVNNSEVITERRRFVRVSNIEIRTVEKQNGKIYFSKPMRYERVLNRCLRLRHGSSCVSSSRGSKRPISFYYKTGNMDTENAAPARTRTSDVSSGLVFEWRSWDNLDTETSFPWRREDCTLLADRDLEEEKITEWSMSTFGKQDRATCLDWLFFGIINLSLKSALSYHEPLICFRLKANLYK